MIGGSWSVGASRSDICKSAAAVCGGEAAVHFSAGGLQRDLHNATGSVPFVQSKEAI